MRFAPAFALVGLLAAGPAMAADIVDQMLEKARNIVRQHQLLTQSEEACSTFIFAGIDTHQVADVRVLERHDDKCAGEAGSAPRRFDLLMDLRGGPTKWDKNPDTIMRPIP